MIRKFSFSQKTALTIENGKVEVWSPGSLCPGGQYQVFEDKYGKVLLKSDDGHWWQQNKEQAFNCQYAQLWLGEFPYGSFCWAIRVGSDDSVSIETISTDINPRGLSESDKWVQECLAFVPEGVKS